MTRTIVNEELSSITLERLCSAISLCNNNYVDWFMCWEDMGELDAFFYNAGYSTQRKEVPNSSSANMFSDDDLRITLDLHNLLEQYGALDLSISRWRRSKRSQLNDEKLIELRIALEAVLLADDKGAGEKRHRLAIRGGWLLGETFEKRKEYSITLRDTYDYASSVIHGGNIKKSKLKEATQTIADAQDLCRMAILKILKKKAMPNWSDLVLGRDLV